MWRTWLGVGWLAGCPFGAPDRTCDDVVSEFDAERAAIGSCATDGECGQVLAGTSCGCTRDLVVRLDADPGRFFDLVDESADRECDLGMTSVCDCPQVAGFRCDAGSCAWNYISDWPYLPQCHADSGDAYTIEAAALDGTELVVTVGFGGGCAPHELVLCWPDQAFLESYPIQASLELHHDAHDDPCDAWLVQERRFDVQPLVDASGLSSGTIVIHIGTYELPLVIGARR